MICGFAGRSLTPMLHAPRNKAEAALGPISKPGLSDLKIRVESLAGRG